LPPRKAAPTLATMTGAPADGALTIDADDFQARCFELLEALEAKRLTRVVVTSRGRVVAEIIPPGSEAPRLWGAMRGSVTVMPGVDLTEPVLDEPLDAELGMLHR
jgi:antitoxin (DNA-binding transcriptional repressor) of toxin-antitoxin stability system